MCIIAEPRNSSATYHRECGIPPKTQRVPPRAAAKPQAAESSMWARAPAPRPVPGSLMTSPITPGCWAGGDEQEDSSAAGETPADMRTRANSAPGLGLQIIPTQVTRRLNNLQRWDLPSPF